MNVGDLERRTDRALRRLPMPRAPHTLLPRVLAAAARLAQRPWYSRTWFTWPAPLRVASLVMGVLLMGVSVAMAPQMSDAGAAMSQYLDVALSAMPRMLDVITGIAAIAQVMLRTLFQPAVIVGLGILVLLVVTCGACWKIVNRLTLTSETA